MYSWKESRIFQNRYLGPRYRFFLEVRIDIDHQFSFH